MTQDELIDMAKAAGMKLAWIATSSSSRSTGDTTSCGVSAGQRHGTPGS
jgi:glucan phosphoethanolaminetransferase (alkaline phosphatase superfamily)